MNETSGTNATSEIPPLKITRTFAAPRATVFEAWSTAEHLKRWFAPSGFTVPQARLELRAGGVFELCMRAPDGAEHWMRGHVTDVAPPERLAFDVRVADGKGHALFRALTEASFVEAAGGTRLDIVQRYTLIDPDAAWMMKGAPQGWGETLDKLAAEIARLAEPHLAARARTPNDASRSVVHARFHLERVYDAPIEHVFGAFADIAAKSRWFSGDADKSETLERKMDFRVGGSETLDVRWQGGVVSRFAAVYHDIIAPERIVYSYTMHLDERKISVSLATIEMKTAGAGRTALKITEQGTFLDGYDDAGSRQEGTGQLLDRLGTSLKG